MKTIKKYRVVKLEKPYVGIPLGRDYAIQFSEKTDDNGNDCWEYFEQSEEKKNRIWAYQTFNDALARITSPIEANVVLESERLNPEIRNK